MNEVSESNLKYIIARVIKNAKENLDEIKKEKQDDFLDGKRLAYYETLDIIKNELSASEIDLSQYDLNIDIDKFA